MPGLQLHRFQIFKQQQYCKYSKGADFVNKWLILCVNSDASGDSALSHYRVNLKSCSAFLIRMSHDVSQF